MMKRRIQSHLFGLLALLLLLPGQSFAQNLRVTGKVIDEQGEGVIGAGVVIQGTTTGTITDMDGIRPSFRRPRRHAGGFLCRLSPRSKSWFKAGH
jgi:hypothetical protein